MFNALMGMFSDPIFWMMVVAVMVGYIFVKALPFVLVLLMYVLGGILFVLGYFLGMIVVLVTFVATQVRNAFKGD